MNAPALADGTCGALAPDVDRPDLEHGTYVCTLPAAHAGEHAARALAAPTTVLHRWRGDGPADAGTRRKHAGSPSTRATRRGPLTVDGPRPAVERVAPLARVVTARERLVLLMLALASPDGVTAAVDVADVASWAGLLRGETHGVLHRLAKPTDYRPALVERVDVDRAPLATFRLFPDDDQDGGRP